MSDLHQVASEKMKEIAAKYNTSDDNSMREISPEEFERMVKSGSSGAPSQPSMNNTQNRVSPKVEESPIFMTESTANSPVIGLSNLPGIQPPVPTADAIPTQTVYPLPQQTYPVANQPIPTSNTTPIVQNQSVEEDEFDDDDEMTDTSLPEPIPERKSFATNSPIIQGPNSPQQNTGNITKSEVIQLLKDVDPVEADRQALSIMKEINEFRKKLMIEQGLTPEEADTAARNRLNRKTVEANTEWTNQHPPVVNVTVSKETRDNVKFTKAEKEKLTYAKQIRLVEVENEELENIKIKSIPKSNITQTLKRIEGSISRYSGPLPITGDYITVNGAQTMYLVSAVYSQDESMVDVIRKKASLAYEKFMDGTYLHKQNEYGKTIMSYSDFIDTVSYYDLDMILYYIYAASSMEIISNVLPCNRCGVEYETSYNTKTLLNMDDISDHLKGNIEFILVNQNNSELLEEHHKSESGIIRMKSPFTKNIYDIDRNVSIAKALAVFSNLNMEDQYASYISPMVLHLHRFMVLDPSDNQYINIAPSKSETDSSKKFIDRMINAVRQIPEEDIKLITSYIKNYTYIPKFKIESKCPSCGINNSEELYINGLVFLKAQNMEVQIEE